MDSSLPLLAALFLAGAVGWTAAEYLLHRFLMHGLKGRGMASREHLTHHARREYFVSTGQKVFFGVVVTAVMAPCLVALVGPVAAASFQGGFLGMYLLYEWLHRRAHTHAPKTPYGRWLRRHHFHHHFGRPLENHGVTSPVFDLLFGTNAVPAGPIRVPRRLAMRWLLTPAGELEPAFAADYVLVGRPPATPDFELTPAEEAPYRTAAFQNDVPPESPEP